VVEKQEIEGFRTETVMACLMCCRPVGPRVKSIVTYVCKSCKSVLRLRGKLRGHLNEEHDMGLGPYVPGGGVFQYFETEMV